MGGGLHADCRGRSWIVGLFLHTECRGESRVFLFITDCRIFSSHGVSRKVTDFFVPNYRIVELILSITRRIAEGHELSNYRINTFNHTECRRRSRIFLHTECWECGGVGDEEGWGGCLFLYVTVKIMCISWVSQTSIRR